MSVTLKEYMGIFNCKVKKLQKQINTLKIDKDSYLDNVVLGSENLNSEDNYSLKSINTSEINALDNENPIKINGDVILSEPVQITAGHQLHGQTLVTHKSLIETNSRVDDNAQTIAEEITRSTIMDEILDTRLTTVSMKASANTATSLSNSTSITTILRNTDPAALDSFTEAVNAFEQLYVGTGLENGSNTPTSNPNGKDAPGLGNSGAYVADQTTTYLKTATSLKNADTLLDTAITAEATTARSAEASNEAAISTEASTARSAEASNEAAISTEASTARSAEASNEAAISTEASTARSAEASNATAISDEASTARSAEASNATAISDEASTARSAEASNATAISDEASTARAAEASNATAISDEASTARATEQANAGAISDEASTARAAEGVNSTAIAAEATTARAAEGVNSTAILRIALPIVTISGAPTQNQTLTLGFTSTSIFNCNYTNASITWYRGTSVISGETDYTYTLVQADVGLLIHAKVTLTRTLPADNNMTINPSVGSINMVYNNNTTIDIESAQTTAIANVNDAQ